MKNFVITDFEWTSWKGNYTGKNLEEEKRQKWQKKEIIQIGAIKVNENFKIEKELNIYVKPVFNPVLSEYIKELTGLKQSLIDKKGLEFEIALKMFLDFTDNNLIISNGDDGKVLHLNLKYHNIKKKYPNIFNVKSIFRDRYMIPRNMLHSTVIHSYFGYKLSYKKFHNPIEDCKNILKVIKKINFNFNSILYKRDKY